MTLETARDYRMLFDALLYEAPFLVEKLLKERIADSQEEAEALFTELKRYLVLARTDHSYRWQMYSARVDETWHQFVLFTEQYADFCERYFDGYVHHRPSNSPGAAIAAVIPKSTWSVFESTYRGLFGEAPSALWDDAGQVTLARRLINDRAGDLDVRSFGDDFDLIDGETVLVSVNAVTAPALLFIASTPAFYVREIPGLSELEKVGLVRAFVEHHLLRIAP